MVNCAQETFMASQSLGESLVLLPAQCGIIATQENSQDVSLKCVFAGGDKPSLMDGQAVSCLLRFAMLTIAFYSRFFRDKRSHLRRQATKRRAEVMREFAFVDARCVVTTQTWQQTMERRQKEKQMIQS
jgi:hypothetical protein